jgi:lipid II:glycine glycyltransferase (peptidoglycan interpeptide bridge formation enzyme)
MHAYVVDSELERVRLLYSASHFRTSANSEERNAIGRANRLLHWHEIETLGRAGYTTYDLGGIPINDTDPEKNAIARFKSEFGGTHLIEFNGIVCRNALLRNGLSFLRRIRA